MFGFVPPRGRYRKSFGCYARPADTGSWDQIWLVTPLAGEYAIHATLYNKSISLIFGQIVNTLKQMWTRPSDITQVVEQLTNTFSEQSRTDKNFQEALVNGIVQANTNIASLQGRLIETLPSLADSTRPHARGFVRPVGETCNRIVQFPAGVESVISDSDAEVIRGDAAMEVDPMKEFRVNQISEVNIRTGHCILDVEGFSTPIPGKITDPSISLPNNAYTQALNTQSGVTVQAKAVRQSGEIRRLYISNASRIT